MKIEEINIEDATDANYVIRKFFNGQLKNLKMSQMEQLVLTVYNMGKGKTASAGCESPVLEAPPVEPPPPAPVVTNPFKINDRARVIESAEIGRTGMLIKTDTVGTVNSINGDKVSFLFESDEDGEMIETAVLFSKLEKIT